MPSVQSGSINLNSINRQFLLAANAFNPDENLVSKNADADLERFDLVDDVYFPNLTPHPNGRPNCQYGFVLKNTPKPGEISSSGDEVTLEDFLQQAVSRPHGYENERNR